MKVVHIDPGAGGTFYCQNCMRDCALVRALRRQGHDVTMIPMYLPILIDTEGISGDIPVFFGGINVFLQQRFSIFRKTPRWLDKLFDARWMLKLAAGQEGSTDASELGPMTHSMLQGSHGHQKKELDRLIDWLKHQEKPDIIHISNGLLLGLAEDLKQALGVPIVCSLQDEKAWLHGMDTPNKERCWDAMAEQVKHVDQFIAVSQWYADVTAERMKIPANKICVVPLGIELVSDDDLPRPPETPVLGYLSKMTESLGLGRLVDAFITLKQNPALSQLKLRVTGGQLGADAEYVTTLKAKLAEHGLEGDAEFLSHFESKERRNFLRSLSVLSVPADEGEAFGMYIPEALAEGVPVVQPRAGGFPEVVEATGGGVLYDTETPGALVQALESLLIDPEKAQAMGARGRSVVLERYSVDHMAQNIIDVYENLA